MAVESVIKRSDLFPPSQTVKIVPGGYNDDGAEISGGRPSGTELGTATVTAAGVLTVKKSVTEGPFIAAYKNASEEWFRLESSNMGYSQAEAERLEVPAASGVPTGTLQRRINRLRAELGC